MKKIWVIIILPLLVISLVGCGSSTDIKNDSNNEQCEELLNEYIDNINTNYDSEFSHRAEEIFLSYDELEWERENSLEYFDDSISIYKDIFVNKIERLNVGEEVAVPYISQIDNRINELKEKLNANFDAKKAAMPQSNIKDVPELDFSNFRNVYEPLYHYANPDGNGFHDFDNYIPIQVDEIDGVWTYLMISDFKNPNENAMAELGQATFICDVEHSRGSMELYPCQMRNGDGTYSNIDPEDGAYEPFTGDVWINSRDNIHDTATIDMLGGTNHDEEGDSNFQGLYMFKDAEGHECIIGILVLPVGGIIYWMVLMR